MLYNLDGITNYAERMTFYWDTAKGFSIKTERGLVEKTLPTNSYIKVGDDFLKLTVIESRLSVIKKELLRANEITVTTKNKNQWSFKTENPIRMIVVFCLGQICPTQHTRIQIDGRDYIDEYVQYSYGENTYEVLNPTPIESYSLNQVFDWEFSSGFENIFFGEEIRQLCKERIFREKF